MDFPETGWFASVIALGKSPLHEVRQVRRDFLGRTERRARKPGGYLRGSVPVLRKNRMDDEIFWVTEIVIDDGHTGPNSPRKTLPAPRLSSFANTAPVMNRPSWPL